MKEVSLISAIIIAAGVLAYNVIRDYRYWLDTRAINHNNRFWIRMWCLVPSAVGFTLYKTGRVEITAETLYYLGVSSLMIAFAWANLFSGIRNKLCGQLWHFAGSDGPEDGVLENMLQNHPWLQWVKVACGIFFITLYIII